MNELLGWYGYDSVDRNELAARCATRANGTTSTHPPLSEQMAAALVASSARLSAAAVRSAINENRSASAVPTTSGIVAAACTTSSPAPASAASTTPSHSAGVAKTLVALVPTTQRPTSARCVSNNNTAVSSPESSSHQSHSPSLPRTTAALCMGIAAAASGSGNAEDKIGESRANRGGCPTRANGQSSAFTTTINAYNLEYILQ